MVCTVRVMRHRPALDGLRALAIAGVLVVHVAPDALPGGAQGVTVFFVLSGYLITTMLLDEHRNRGRIDLAAFYVRRAARLLPALVIVVEATVFAGVLIGWHYTGSVWISRNTLVGAGSVLGYCSNLLMSLGSRPPYEAFAWSWSLAIEEQFYLVWPALLLWRLSRGRGATALAVSGMVVVMAERARLVLAGVSGSRVDMGTDTRLDAIMLGCVLALLLARPAWLARAARVAPATFPAGLALIALAYTMTISGHLHRYYLLQIPLAEIGAGLTIAAIAAGHSPLMRLLALRPVVYLGGISYGIYLWNLLIRDVWTMLFEFPRGLGIAGWAASVVGVAALSARFLERPIRDRGRAWAHARGERPDVESVNAGELVDPVVVEQRAASAFTS